MPKYLLLKHYRGGPEPHRRVPPIDQWAPEDVEAHMALRNHVSELLEEHGEYVDAQALAPAHTWVRYGGPDAAPVSTDGPPPSRRGDTRRAAARRHRGGGRHSLSALLLLPPRPRARLPGGADPARRRRPHHPGDRRRLLRAGGDDGAADQPGQARPAGAPPVLACGPLGIPPRRNGPRRHRPAAPVHRHDVTVCELGSSSTVAVAMRPTTSSSIAFGRLRQAGAWLRNGCSWGERRWAAVAGEHNFDRDGPGTGARSGVLA